MGNKGRGRREDHNSFCEKNQVYAILVGLFLGNMEPIKLRKIQRETKRQSDAEVLNLVLWDLPAISSHFLSHDLGYVPLCISPFG